MSRQQSRRTREKPLCNFGSLPPPGPFQGKGEEEEEEEEEEGQRQTHQVFVAFWGVGVVSGGGEVAKGGC